MAYIHFSPFGDYLILVASVNDTPPIRGLRHIKTIGLVHYYGSINTYNNKVAKSLKDILTGRPGILSVNLVYYIDQEEIKN